MSQTAFPNLDKIKRTCLHVFRISQCGVNQDELMRILNELSDLPDDPVQNGTGEYSGYNLLVKRVLSDMTPPTAKKSQFYPPRLDHPKGKSCVDLLSQIISSTLVQNVTGHHVNLRRVQFNSMIPGNFIGLHDDYSANKSYHYTVVVGASSNYSGGFLTLDFESNTKVALQPQLGDAIVFSSQVSHQITKIQSGKRDTIVAFLSRDETSFL